MREPEASIEYSTEAAPLAQVNLKLAALREPVNSSPADCRIQAWLDDYLGEEAVQPRLPARTSLPLVRARHVGRPWSHRAIARSRPRLSLASS